MPAKLREPLYIDIKLLICEEQLSDSLNEDEQTVIKSTNKFWTSRRFQLFPLWIHKKPATQKKSPLTASKKHSTKSSIWVVENKERFNLRMVNGQNYCLNISEFDNDTNSECFLVKVRNINKLNSEERWI